MIVNYFKHSPYSWQQGRILARRYLTTGITYCKSCRGQMDGQGKTDAMGEHVGRLACKPFNNRGKRVGCGKVFRIADPVEYLVTEAVLPRFDCPEVAEALAPADNQERVQELNSRS